MKQQKICIIGDGLTGLIAAAIISKENVSIDLYSGNKNKNKKLDNRTTAISESNFQYIKNNLNLSKASFFWSCNKINLFFEDREKIINFFNFNEKNKKIMHIFQNKYLKNILNKIILKKKNIKIIRKDINEINNKHSFVVLSKKKIFYDLIILSTGGLSKFYDKIEAGRSIKKNYEEVAITGLVKHESKIDNASQFFLNSLECQQRLL